MRAAGAVGEIIHGVVCVGEFTCGSSVVVMIGDRRWRVLSGEVVLASCGLIYCELMQRYGVGYQSVGTKECAVKPSGVSSVNTRSSRKLHPRSRLT